MESNNHPTSCSIDQLVAEIMPVHIAQFVEPELTVLAPSENLTKNRVILSKHSVFLEHRTNWLASRCEISSIDPSVTLPYPALSGKLRFDLEQVPFSLIQKVVMRLFQSCPIEDAALFIFDACTRQWRVDFPEQISSSAHHVRYSQPRLISGESVVIDIHSHGTAPAFFSKQYDLDDTGSTKLSVVLGSLNASPSIAARLLVRGHEIALDDNCEILNQALDEFAVACCNIA